VLFIVNEEDLGAFKSLFKDGSHIGMNIQYKVQKKPNGLAEGLIIAEEFLNGDDVFYLLGDNIFFGHDLIKHTHTGKEGRGAK